LAQHPNVCSHHTLEYPVFVIDQEYYLGYVENFRRYFYCANQNSLKIFAKSVSILDDKKAQRRLVEHNPNVKIVIVLRNPVDRAYSAYWYARRCGWEDMVDFPSALKADPARFNSDEIRIRNCAYINKGLYIKHIRNIMNYFSTEQVKIFLLEDIRNNPEKICKDIWAWCGLDDTFALKTVKKHNVSAAARSEIIANWLHSPNRIGKILRRILPSSFVLKVKSLLIAANEIEYIPPPMDPQVRGELTAYYKPYNRQLGRLLGRDLNYWNN